MRPKFYTLAESIVQHYLDFHVSRASAGLSYFLMLTVFPLLICLYTMLGELFPAEEEINELLYGILPESAVETLTDYLGYVSSNSSIKMTVVALAAMATSSAAGFRIVDKLMMEMRGTRRRQRLAAFLFSFVFSLVFLSALYLAALLMVTGEWFILFVDEYIEFINISASWSWLRFVMLFLLLFVMIMGVYRITAPKDTKVILVPGAVFGSVTLVGVSIVFSWFIGASARYPLVYGSLASVMIMLFWLYVCGNVLFLGNIMNIALEDME